MDLSLLMIVGAGLLAGSAVLSVGIEQLLRRFGVTATVPEERSGGLRDIAARARERLRSRSATDRMNRE